MNALLIYDFNQKNNDSYVKYVNDFVSYFDMEGITLYICDNLNAYAYVSEHIEYIEFVVSLDSEYFTLKLIEELNIPVFNSSRIHQLGYDKIALFSFLDSKGIECVKHVPIPLLDDKVATQKFLTTRSIQFPLMLTTRNNTNKELKEILFSPTSFHSLDEQLLSKNLIGKELPSLNLKESHFKLTYLNNKFIKGSEVQYISAGCNNEVSCKSIDYIPIGCKYIANKILRAIKCDFCSIEFTYDLEGNIYLFDINFLPDLYMFNSSSSNLIKLIAKHCKKNYKKAKYFI